MLTDGITVRRKSRALFQQHRSRRETPRWPRGVSISRCCLPPECLLMSALMEDTILLARKRYTEGAAISKVLAETGMSLGTLYLWLDGGPKDALGRRRFPAIP